MDSQDSKRVQTLSVTEAWSYTYDVFTPRTDLDGQTITISEIGNDYNVSNNFTLGVVYKMERRIDTQKR